MKPAPHRMMVRMEPHALIYVVMAAAGLGFPSLQAQVHTLRVDTLLEPSVKASGQS
jgi:hypothetical protein